MDKATTIFNKLASKAESAVRLLQQSAGFTRRSAKRFASGKGHIPKIETANDLFKLKRAIGSPGKKSPEQLAAGMMRQLASEVKRGTQAISTPKLF